MTAIRPPTDTEIEDVIKMLTGAYANARSDFPHDTRILQAYHDRDPEGGPDNWVVLWDDGRPVSALRIFYREVTGPDGPFRVGGIGNVGTDPGYGGRGLGTRVMEAAHETLAREGVTTTILVTDIPDFYARLGYRAIQQRELMAALPPHLAPGFRTVSWRRPVPEWIRNAHAAAATLCSGRVMRPSAYWDEWVHRFKVEGQRLQALGHDGAYLIGRAEEGGKAYRVLEGGGPADRLTELVGRAMGRSLRLKTPDEPVFREVIDRLGGQLAPRVRTGIMARALAPGAPGPEAFPDFLEIDTF